MLSSSAGLGWVGLAQPLDTALVQTKDPVRAALLFKVGLQLVSCPNVAAAVGASNPSRRRRVRWNPEPDYQAVWTLKQMIQKRPRACIRYGRHGQHAL